LPGNQPCADDLAVKYGVDVFSDFVALVCSKDSPAKMHLRHQQQQPQPVSSRLSVDNTLSSVTEEEKILIFMLWFLI